PARTVSAKFVDVPQPSRLEALLEWGRTRERAARGSRRSSENDHLDSFRHLAVTLDRGDGARPRVVLLTSPRDAEGTRFIASGIAMAAAASNRGVLLVDADLHSPSQHSALGVDAAPGLAELLASPDGTSTKTFIQRAACGVYVLASGAGGDVATLFSAEGL